MAAKAVAHDPAKPAGCQHTGWATAVLSGLHASDDDQTPRP